jgi:hypothetical protein
VNIQQSMDLIMSIGSVHTVLWSWRQGCEFEGAYGALIEMIQGRTSLPTDGIVLNEGNRHENLA